MIYLIGFAFLLAAFAFFRRARHEPVLTILFDVLASASLGWIAGFLIGAGARVGMWAIPFFNGTESRITFDGTFRVILTFSLFGIALGVLYELLFRRLLREHGILFGLLIVLIAWYPLGSQGVQQLRFSPSFIPMATVTLVVMGITFIPFAVVLEFLLTRWHLWHSARSYLVNHGV